MLAFVKINAQQQHVEQALNQSILSTSVREAMAEMGYKQRHRRNIGGNQSVI